MFRGHGDGVWWRNLISLLLNVRKMVTYQSNSSAYRPQECYKLFCLFVCVFCCCWRGWYASRLNDLRQHLALFTKKHSCKAGVGNWTLQHMFSLQLSYSLSLTMLASKSWQPKRTTVAHLLYKGIRSLTSATSLNITCSVKSLGQLPIPMLSYCTILCISSH